MGVDDYFRGLAQQRAEAQAATDHEHELLRQRVAYGHEHPQQGDLAASRQILDSYYRDARTAELKAAAEAEQQRLAQRTQREIWLDTLSSADRAYVSYYEQINHTPWPGAPV